MYVGEVHEALKVHMSQLRGYVGKMSPIGVLLDGVCDVFSRICIPLMPSVRPIYFCPRFFFPPVMQLMTQNSGWNETELDLLGKVHPSGET